MREISSIEGVCEVEIVAPRGGVGEIDLLIEIPHGATRAAHFEGLGKRLVGQLPENLIDFFFVNTDVGAPECAQKIARLLADEAGKRVMVLRSLVPRTFVDCNRLLGDDPKAGGELNAALPDYVTDERDIDLLLGLHRDYVETARRAYRRVCGTGGLALALHTYAPISIHFDDDEGSDIVSLLHAAYEPGNYESWPLRPEVDIISETEDGRLLAPGGLVAAIREGYAGIGVEAKENDTYQLHPMTMAYEFSVEYPGKVICVELGRATLAEEFTPFAEMRISEAKVKRMARPIAEGLRRFI